jgi:hypothetical protein
VSDVGAAIAFVHAHAREWGGDPARLGLIGHSAGAHLVALAATDGRFIGDAAARAAVRCVFANDTEAFDIPAALDGEASRQLDLYTNAFGDDALVWADASPIQHIDARTPPMLLTRRGSTERQQILDGYAAALDAAGVRFAIVNAGTLSHAEVNQLAGSDVSDEKLKQIFDELDEDGSGELDHDEIAKALLNLGRTELEIHAMLSTQSPSLSPTQALSLEAMLCSASCRILHQALLVSLIIPLPYFFFDEQLLLFCSHLLYSHARQSSQVPCWIRASVS